MTETRSATDLEATPQAGGEGVRSGGSRRRPTRDRPSALSRLARFYREVVAELRKVIWPSRKELLTYTSVVLVFVVIMVGVIGALDYGFTQAVLRVFG